VAGVAAVSTSEAFASETPDPFTTEIAVGRDFEGGRFEVVGLRSPSKVTHSVDDDLSFNLAGEEFCGVGKDFFLGIQE
jgi:hypothetical protein